MIYIKYIIRILLALIFIWSGIEKLYIPYDPAIFRANAADVAEEFFTFYDLLQTSGYLYFVGFFQLACGLLLVLKRTYLLGSIMLVPLTLCLFMTHVFFSKNVGYIIFDLVLMLLNLVLILGRYEDWISILNRKQGGII